MHKKGSFHVFATSTRLLCLIADACMQASKDHHAPVELATSPDGALLVSAASGDVKVWSLSERKLLKTYSASDVEPAAVMVSLVCLE